MNLIFWSPQTPKPAFAHLSSLVIRNQPWPTCLAWNRSKAAAFCATPPALGTPRAGNGMHPAMTHRTPLPQRWNRTWDTNGSRWRHLYCCDSAFIFGYLHVEGFAKKFGVVYKKIIGCFFRVSFQISGLMHWMMNGTGDSYHLWSFTRPVDIAAMKHHFLTFGLSVSAQNFQSQGFPRDFEWSPEVGCRGTVGCRFRFCHGFCGKQARLSTSVVRFLRIYICIYTYRSSVLVIFSSVVYQQNYAWLTCWVFCLYIIECLRLMVHSFFSMLLLSKAGMTRQVPETVSFHLTLLVATPRW